MRRVITISEYVQDIRGQFYFSSPGVGGVTMPELGEPVVVVSEATGNLLALGKIIKQGEPYAECNTVQITQRFD